MRTISILACGALAAALLGGCADDYYGGGYYRGGYYAGPVAYDYDGFYDGYYGPFIDGYWSRGVFFYSDGRGRWLRDRGHHFRRDAAPGFNAFHGHGPPGRRDRR